MNKLLQRPPIHHLSKEDKEFFEAIHEEAMRYYTSTKNEILEPLDKEIKHLEFITQSLETLPQVQKKLMEKDTLEGDEAQMSDPVYHNLKEGVEDFLEGCMGDKQVALDNLGDVFVEGRKRLEMAVANGYTGDVRVAHEDWKWGKGNG
ncbi:hypothetical protein HYALB_00004776 [Hymenoscyphus albidus]|uniref:Uncharacterized protein n=1 Tax=Hymenoscyphus albidus TaxID=595503 RepID=A0A9N9LMV4_9HELO|nr:hypothetical protein HYALB_00004776 [Hymenoscyphus albidus]